MDRFDNQIVSLLLAETDDPVDARVLDAAAELIGRDGEQSVTMGEIATHSKVSRATIFRRFGTKNVVVNRVILRELRKFVLGTLEAIDDGAGPATAIAELLTHAIRFSRVNPAFRRLVADDPQRLVNFSRSSELGAMDLARALVATVLVTSEPESELPIEAVHLADVVCHLAIAYALVPDSSMDVEDTAEFQQVFLRLVGPALGAHRDNE
ncbi:MULTISPECIES: TetR/AcrR family transcriptional regulator [unclassified Mycobacteroides]|uniref:TetR/AcrR family transcriptional regulator n=1 Tax=unclassified Mycobacteroides TaxID=2618759 RepID=UPI0012DCBE4B|nr:MULTISPECIES: TetR/AcrR family transcriptional regulator [unclassified Mycobacteroides]MUM17014.1 transcriptional regulator [Mycobacteroides sp. CBMA 326]